MKPRVEITYDIETEEGTLKRELPFVVGVMGDYSGHRENLPPLNTREFIDINTENFDQVMGEISPELNLQVKNTITNEGKLNVHLNFNQIKDFEPESIIKQIPELDRLYKTRNLLKDWLTKIDKDPKLAAEAQHLLSNLLNSEES